MTELTDKLEAIIRPVVEGQLRSFTHDHPEVLDAVEWNKRRLNDRRGMFVDSAAKRIVNDLLGADIRARLVDAIAARSGGDGEGGAGKDSGAGSCHGDCEQPGAALLAAPGSRLTDKLEALDKAATEYAADDWCTRIKYGKCTTRRCNLNGDGGITVPIDFNNASCPRWRLQIALDALRAAAPDGDLVEVAAYTLWLSEAQRAAPNVAKNRTIDAFRTDVSDAERIRWQQSATAVLAAVTPIIEARGRAAVVEWLRALGDWPRVTSHATTLADAIERGDHRKAEPDAGEAL